MRITDPNQLKTLDTIYSAFAFSEPHKRGWCSIHKYEVLDCPLAKDPNWILLRLDTVQPPLTYYFKVDLTNRTWKHHRVGVHTTSQERSMQDMGIISNNYNLHQTFDNLDEAKQYICNVLSVNLDGMICDYDRAMKVI